MNNLNYGLYSKMNKEMKLKIYMYVYIVIDDVSEVKMMYNCWIIENVVEEWEC
jgi:hypothetical protein